MAFKWVSTNDTRYVFMVISSVQVVVCLLSVPMCKLHLSLSPSATKHAAVTESKLTLSPLL